MKVEINTSASVPAFIVYPLDDNPRMNLLMWKGEENVEYRLPNYLTLAEWKKIRKGIDMCFKWLADGQPVGDDNG